MMDRLQARGAGFLMPCSNTDNVVAALDEFARGRRDEISENVIENGRGTVPYSDGTGQKGQKGQIRLARGEAYRVCDKLPVRQDRKVRQKAGDGDGIRQDRGVQGQDPDQVRKGTHAVFYYPLTLFNGRIVAGAEVSDGTEGQSIMTCWHSGSGYHILYSGPNRP